MQVAEESAGEWSIPFLRRWGSPSVTFFLYYSPFARTSGTVRSRFFSPSFSLRERSHEASGTLIGDRGLFDSSFFFSFHGAVVPRRFSLFSPGTPATLKGHLQSFLSFLILPMLRKSAGAPWRRDRFPSFGIGGDRISLCPDHRELRSASVPSFPAEAVRQAEPPVILHLP